MPKVAAADGLGMRLQAVQLPDERAADLRREGPGGDGNQQIQTHNDPQRSVHDAHRRPQGTPDACYPPGIRHAHTGNDALLVAARRNERSKLFAAVVEHGVQDGVVISPRLAKVRRRCCRTPARRRCQKR